MLDEKIHNTWTEFISSEEYKEYFIDKYIRDDY
jgi:hypothetical protein